MCSAKFFFSFFTTQNSSNESYSVLEQPKMMRSSNLMLINFWHRFCWKLHHHTMPSDARWGDLHIKSTLKHRKCSTFLVFQVMEALTHINKRLKTRPQVQLPVAALFEQYQKSDSAFLHNFSIIYITMGFPRLSFEKQVELAPAVLNSLEGKPENHQDKWVYMVAGLC